MGDEHIDKTLDVGDSAIAETTLEAEKEAKEEAKEVLTEGVDLNNEVKESEESMGVDDSDTTKKNETIREKKVTNMENNNMENNINKEIKEILIDIRDKNAKELQYVEKQTKLAIGTSVLSLLIVIILAIAVFSLVPNVVKVLNQANGLISQANEMMTEVDGIIGGVNDKLNDVYGMIDGVNDKINDVYGMIDGVNDKLNDVYGMVDQVGDMLDSVDELVGNVNDSVETALEQATGSISNVESLTGQLVDADIPGAIDNVNSLVTSVEGNLNDSVDKITSIDVDSLNQTIKSLSDVVAPLSKLLGGKAK